MKKITLNDLNFKKLKLLTNKTSESIIYYDKNNIYKLFTDINKVFLKEKQEKLEYLEQCYLPENFLKPHLIIMDNSLCVGCVAPYKKSNHLNNVNMLNIYLKHCYLVSHDLQIVHNHNPQIAFADVHGRNILIHKLSHYFCDIDGCFIKDLKVSYCVSNNYDNYLDDYNIKEEVVNQNSDKVQLYIMLFFKIFHKNIYYISESEYLEKMKGIPILKDLYSVFKTLQNPLHEVPEVPYLHELILKK